jgi:hypothetical protein
MNDPVSNPEAVAGEVAARLNALQAEDTDPRVVEFARFLAGRFQGADDVELYPQSFVNASILAIADLQRGLSPAQEPIEGPLVKREKELYDQLHQSVPTLGRIGISADFGREVEDIMVQYGIIPAPEAAGHPTPDPTEIITEPIRDIETARTVIVDDARNRLVGLDWNSLGVSPEFVHDAFERFYLIALRRCEFVTPINALSEEYMIDRPIIADAPPSRKMDLSDGKWLYMAVEEIPGEYATAMRDHLFIIMVEAVAEWGRMNPEEVVYHFYGQDVDGPFPRAAGRLARFLDENPTLMKGGGNPGSGGVSE